MTTDRSERLFTVPLLVFLTVVLLVFVQAARVAFARPTMEGAVEALSDGDLDGAERRSMLRALLDFGQGDTGPRGRWAAWLAAVALDDPEAVATAMRRITTADGVPDGPPRGDERRFLDLGDTLVAGVFGAAVAEAEGNVDEARRRWTQVGQLATLRTHGAALRLAADALLRLQ